MKLWSFFVFMEMKFMEISKEIPLLGITKSYVLRGQTMKQSKVDLVEILWHTRKRMFYLRGLGITQTFISLLPWKKVGMMWPGASTFSREGR